MILTRYLNRQVTTTTTVVLGFLLLLMLGGRVIRYFGIAAEGRLDVSILFRLIGYQLPYFLELILPLAFFIGLILTLGQMYVDNEMSILNASGVSRNRIGRMLLPSVIILTLLEAGISLVAKPWGIESADTLLQTQAVNSALDLIRPGQFISSGDYHLYVGELSKAQGELLDVVLIYKSEPLPNMENPTNTDMATQNEATNPLIQSSANQDIIITAKRAKQVKTAPDASNHLLALYEGRRYQLGAQSRAYNQVGFAEYQISIAKPQTQTDTPLGIDALSSSQLWSRLQSPSQQQSTTAMSDTQLRAQMWGELGYRLSLPWLMVLAILLALPLSKVHPRQGRWLKLVPAILLYVSMALVIVSLKSAVSKQKVSVIAYPIALFVFCMLTLYFNSHEKIRLRLQRLPNSDEATSC